MSPVHIFMIATEQKNLIAIMRTACTLLMMTKKVTVDTSGPTKQQNLTLD